MKYMYMLVRIRAPVDKLLSITIMPPKLLVDGLGVIGGDQSYPIPLCMVGFSAIKFYNDAVFLVERISLEHPNCSLRVHRP